MEMKLDLLNCSSQKSIVCELKNGEAVFMSSHIIKFNDYKKKQERSILVTSRGIYNLKNKNIRRFIEITKVKAITISSIGTEFVLHVPSQYDYRYASADRRNEVIFFVLKAHRLATQGKLPIFERDQLNLAQYATTKNDSKKEGIKDIKGEYHLHDDITFQHFLKGEEKEKEMVRKTTKTLYSKQKEQVSLNDFQPKVVLGKGAFGVVLLVEKKDTKVLYAMKSLDKDDIVKKNQIQHTKTEKMILQHVNHPFLVNLDYAFQTNNKLYFIMQFMKGGELFQHLSNFKRFPQKQAKFYTMQIALGLSHLHANGFIYRDIKLENVLMDEHGNVCLTDFGMAKLMKEGQIAKTFCGTPQYLAPEVLEGKGYDKQADWWSLGVLAYEMINGLPPFYDSSQSAMFRLIREANLSFSEKVPLSPEAKDFFTRILRKNPQNRLGSNGDGEEILAHAWFKTIDREKMLKKQLTTPFIPKTTGETWLEGFDQEFVKETPEYEEKEDRKESEYLKKIFQQFNLKK